MPHQFRNDYNTLACKEILEAINKYDLEQNVGYGLDTHSENAKKLIKESFGLIDSDIHFLIGGTQTNMTFISYCLKDYEACLSCNTGHINVHETGAIEGSGHKIISVKGVNGKLTSKDIVDTLKLFTDEHMVKIKMVYISNSTEIGTIYTKDELISLYKTCKENNLYLFIDGARLGVALTAYKNDVDKTLLKDVCDAFYIGGTKNGMMIGEALVINNNNLKQDFRYQIKNKGAMLAKGFLCGIEFERAFSDNLYFDLAKNSNDMAEIIAKHLKENNFDIIDNYTNQLFVTLDSNKANKIMDKFGCELWNDLNNKKTIRIVTSYNTSKEDVFELLNFIDNLK